MVQIRLLGGFGVDQDGRPVDARAWRLRKARTLVKLLALQRDQRLHRDVLLDALWPGRTPMSAVNNLHQALHVARRVLADDRPTNGLLELRDDVVALCADGLVDVDVRRFEQLAAHGRASGDLADLRAAVAAYTGDLLPEDRFEDWATQPREELRHAFCDLLVDLADTATTADPDAGSEIEALDALQRALTIDPLHERAVRSLMRRHAAMGRRSEALALYERLRGDLAATYGTDPDPETQRMYRDLLTDSIEVEEPTQPPRHNLIPALTSFVGREREISDVHRLLERGRLVTLTGVGGAGKTRLAEEAARRLLPAYPDGVWVADLVPVADPHLVADTVAAALGLDPGAGSDPLRTLVAQLATRNLLLVLDSCEHLLAACAALANAVRRNCPGVTVLATSREPLHVPGEVTFRVPSLELPEPEEAGDPDRLVTHSSVRLFVDRAQDVRPGFVLDLDNAASVVEICRRLDGIPLALELAAARMSHLESAEIADRLSEALPLLGRRGEITRHATLRAALEWSHALLSDDEKVLLRRLAVFSGSFSLPSAEQVCADERIPGPDVLDCLGRLVDKSLLLVDHDGPRSRYRLLETIRQFARERLVAAGEAESLEAAHCAHFLELALDQDPERVSVVVERPQLLDVDHDNLRAALGWALRNDPDQALVLGVSLSQYWLARGHFVEGADWLERILEVAVKPSRSRARAVFALATLDARSGLSERLPGLGDEGVAVAEQSDDPSHVVAARVLRGTLLLSSTDLDEVERTATAAIADADSLGAAPVAAAAQGLAAMVSLFREDVEPAQQRFDECLRRLSLIDATAVPFFPAVTICLPLMPVDGTLVPVFEETFLLGRRVSAVQAYGYALSASADVYRLTGDLDSALAAVRRSVDGFADIDDTVGLGHALNHLGCIERDRGLFEPAETHLREALRIRKQLGDRRGENLTLANLGLLSAAAGDPGEGRRFTRIALDRGEAVDDVPAVAGALLDLVIVELFAGQRQAARALAEQAVEAFHPQGYLRLEAWARLLAAELARDDGDSEVLARQGRTAAEIFARLGCRIGTARAAALQLQP
ncbi:BTAD domain-containing putative transcriptional regulator [Kribbella sp. VKM Ac-2568]|uniref:BTAD domain-containing putative transcriptional regulator n=1 Tax=Kribbella sp. VKM Ac-2568 TaxID=2512219 RepID=UPI001051AC98|nr:BTAD domain-containing putative transcriptional regulator [Kribbella sp. VKM Ac-2568]TCM49287.1 putative ATPase [Kribbella sp. VKM Ac-2568]